MNWFSEFPRNGHPARRFALIRRNTSEAGGPVCGGFYAKNPHPCGQRYPLAALSLVGVYELVTPLLPKNA
jgi:hypothetical protein